MYHNLRYLCRLAVGRACRDLKPDLPKDNKTLDIFSGLLYNESVN